MNVQLVTVYFIQMGLQKGSLWVVLISHKQHCSWSEQTPHFSTYTPRLAPPYGSFGCCHSCLPPTGLTNSPFHPVAREHRTGKWVVEAATMPAWSPHTKLPKWERLSPHKASSFPKCSNFSHDMISWGSKQNYSFFLLISPLTKMTRMGTLQRTWNVASIWASPGQCLDVCISLLSLRPHKFAAPIPFSRYKKTSFAGNGSECAGNIMLGGECIASSFIQREFQKDI